ncbi:IS110 family transposase [Paenibacillus aceris]|uniref:IS110 family transposase n=1 Tax=Paenibacillus aceris TaxID=869555 RepID=UPI001F0451EB|nr:IS110 family transposase [Paenibacillus aceris]
MLAIKGIGKDTIAGFLAEIGDIRQYHHPKQITKLAGLNLKTNSSGKHIGQTQITKRGRKRLRGTGTLPNTLFMLRSIRPLIRKKRFRG